MIATLQLGFFQILPIDMSKEFKACCNCRTVNLDINGAAKCRGSATGSFYLRNLIIRRQECVAGIKNKILKNNAFSPIYLMRRIRSAMQTLC